MNIIVCMDNQGGIAFNDRRQSRDSAVVRRIMEMTQGNRLWMSHYSAELFDISAAPQINEDDAYLSEAAPGEFCFVEKQPVGEYARWAESLVIFRWNRDYPADTFFDIDCTAPEWRLINQEQIAGNSHKCITLEVYSR